MRILLIEDDFMIGEAVRQGLTRSGYAVDWVRDAREASAAFANRVHDLAILDLGLPRGDGIQLLKSLRAGGNGVPVLIASARDSVRDRIVGLESGADDYLLKPFDLDELVARVRAVLRRHAGSGSPRMATRTIVLDPREKKVWRHGVEVALSVKEFALLEALMRRPGAVLSRERLEESVYGWGEETTSNAVEVHLHRLRRKLGTPVIKNVRGVGYCMADDA
ncbi:MAG: response regulator transcription factor [Burkholderiaceae bacterium]